MKRKSNFYIDIPKMKFWKYVTTQQCKLKGKKLNGALRFLTLFSNIFFFIGIIFSIFQNPLGLTSQQEILESEC